MFIPPNRKSCPYVTQIILYGRQISAEELTTPKKKAAISFPNRYDRNVETEGTREIFTAGGRLLAWRQQILQD